MTYIDIVFQGPPSAPATFVEVENPSGESISVGEWLQRPDGYWVLRIPRPAPVDSAVVASLIAGARKLLFSDSAFGYEDTKEGDLILRLADALTAVSAERDEAWRIGAAQHGYNPTDDEQAGNFMRLAKRADRAEAELHRTQLDLIFARERADNYRLGAQLGTTRNKEFNEALADLARAREVIEKAATEARQKSAGRLDILRILATYDSAEKSTPDEPENQS